MSRYHCPHCDEWIVLAKFPSGKMVEITESFVEEGKVEYWEEQGLAVQHSVGQPGKENRRALHEGCKKQQRARGRRDSP